MDRSDFEYLEESGEYIISEFLLVFSDESFAGKLDGIFLGKIFQSLGEREESWGCSERVRGGLYL
jgi:hypothetical protein